MVVLKLTQVEMVVLVEVVELEIQQVDLVGNLVEVEQLDKEMMEEVDGLLLLQFLLVAEAVELVGLEQMVVRMPLQVKEMVAMDKHHLLLEHQ